MRIKKGRTECLHSMYVPSSLRGSPERQLERNSTVTPERKSLIIHVGTRREVFCISASARLFVWQRAVRSLRVLPYTFLLPHSLESTKPRIYRLAGSG